MRRLSPARAGAASLLAALALGVTGPAALAATGDGGGDAAWPPEDGELLDGVVAIVNDEPITLFEMRRAAAPYVAKLVSEVDDEDELDHKLLQLQQEVLDNLIDEILISSEARKMGLTASNDKVEEHLKSVMEANGWTEDELTENLRRLGFSSLADYRRHTEREMVKSQAIGIKVGSRVKIDERDVEAELKARLGAAGSVEERRAGHILLRVDSLATADVVAATRDRLAEARQKIVSGGASFEEIARQLSDDVGTKAAGGDLGWFSRGDFDPDFENAAYATPVGTVSEPIRTQFGWHLIKVYDTRDKQVTSAEEIEKIKREIRYNKRQEEAKRLYEQWVKGLKTQAFIEVKDPAYRRTDSPTT